MTKKWIMHIKNAIHLFTHRHTAYLKESTFRNLRPGRTRENRSTKEKPPPAEEQGSGRLLYVYYAVVCWLPNQRNDRFLCLSVHCRSPPGIESFLKFLIFTEDKS